MAATDAFNETFDARHNSETPLWLRLAWLPIPLLLVAMAILSVIGPSSLYTSPRMLLGLNIVFSTVGSMFVAYLVGRSFLTRGTPGLLLLGCGVVFWGGAGVVAIAISRGDVNVNVTIFGLGAWLAALCHLAGVSLSLRLGRTLNPAGLWLAAGYVVALMALGLVSIFTIDGRFPVFFVPGQGGTPVRQLVLGSAVAMFALAAILLRVIYRKSFSRFTFWYACGLALIAVGLFSTMFSSSFSSLLFWTGRSTQWLGGVYMLIAAIASVRESHVWGISLVAALQQSEERFRLLGDNLPDSAVYQYVHEADGRVRFLYFSAGVERLNGVSVQAVLRDAGELHRQIPPEYFARLVEAEARSARDLSDFDMEVPMRRPDGQMRWMRLHSRPRRMPDGRVVWDGVQTDITEQKRAEARLKADLSALTRMHALSGRVLGTEGLQPLLQEVMDVAVSIMAADRGTLQLLEGDSLRIVAHHGHQQPFLEFFASSENRASSCGEAMLRGERVVVEDVENSSLFAGTPSLPVLREAGVRAIQSTPLISRTGMLLGIFTTQWSVPYSPSEHDLWRIDLLARQAADLIENARAEERLRQSEQLYRAIGESINYGVWVCAPDGRNIYASESFLRLVGLTQQQCSDFGWGEVLHPDDAERTFAAWKDCIRTEGNWDIEHRFRGVDGRWHPILARGTPVRDNKGQIVYWAGINLDISNLKETEQALLRSEKLASVGRMAATIAHEINNPLEAVMSLLFLAKDAKELPESTRQYLEMADGELNRIAHITRQSLGFYRESNAPAFTSVNAVLESTVGLLKSRIRAKQAVIEKQWDGDVGITAVAGELRQVFSNLMINSLDAIGEKGTIKLRVSLGTTFSTGRRCVRITVADNGQGIGPSSRQHIFEPFFTTKGTVGTGLGLWVSKQIVDKHGGTIRMRSSNNGERRGTVFSVVLPVSPAVAARVKQQGLEGATTALKMLRERDEQSTPASSFPH